MCVVFMHVYVYKHTCESVHACIHVAISRCLQARGSMPWTLQEQRSPDSIHTHTHRGTALFSWAEEACSEHSSPKCYSMGIRLAIGYRIESLEP